jgi:hypothetical protein
VTPEEKNACNLAALITTEAGGENAAAKAAVGWTVMNRMQRDSVSNVDEAWQGYQHSKPPTQDALDIAKSILSGKMPDPTGGATHFYTPDAMPKEGESTANINVRGGLEETPGVTDSAGRAVKNYRPNWAARSEFKSRSVPALPEHCFKFFREDGNGPVD